MTATPNGLIKYLKWDEFVLSGGRWFGCSKVNIQIKKSGYRRGSGSIKMLTLHLFLLRFLPKVTNDLTKFQIPKFMFCHCPQIAQGSSIVTQFFDERKGHCSIL